MHKHTRSLITTWFVVLGLLSSNIASAYSFDWLNGCCYGACDEYCCDDQCCSNWCFSDQLLYWTAHEDGLAYTDKGSDVLVTDDFTETPLVHPSFDWNLGFRLIAGYTPTCCPWTFLASWTSIENRAHGHRDHNSGAPDFEGSFPIWATSPDTLKGDYVSFARGHWHLDTNIIDLDVLYKYCYNQRLVLTPQLGVRFAILHQDYHTKYFGGTFFVGPERNYSHNKFFGVGPRLGAGASYYLCRGISLKGFVAGTAMLGHFKTTQKEYYLGEKRFHDSRKQNRFAGAFDYQVGAEWKGKILDCFPNVILGAFWEGHIFFDQNRMHRDDFGFFSKDRDLTLNGFTLSASFCY